MVGTLLFCFNLVGDAADLPVMAPVGESIVRTFHEALDRKQYELAEIIAQGVLVKHGDRNELGKAMLDEVEDVAKHNDGPRLTSKYVTSTKVYALFDSTELAEIIRESNNSAQVKQKLLNAEKVIANIKKKNGPRWDIYQAQAAVYDTNLSVVVSGPGFIHDEVRKSLRLSSVVAIRSDP
ncbi:hypothetical protein [Bremerella alba]|uniref:hypothetical protein n=1 Tax=Bremerella alba TaxID=980252 RepID=UPI001A956084|nr:hypothetical protein [Bremerella alba]